MNSHRPHRRTRRDDDLDADRSAGSGEPRVWFGARRARLGLGFVAFVVVMVAAFVAVMQGSANSVSHQGAPLSGTFVAEAGPHDATDTTTGTATDQPTAPVTTVAPLPPAPDGFADSLDQLYASMTATAGKADIPGAPSMPTTDQFAQDVAGLSASDLAALYSASQADSGWAQLAGTYQTASAQASDYVRAAGGRAVVDSVTSALRPSLDGALKANAAPAPSVTATATENFEPDPTPSVQEDPNCPTGAPGGDYGEDSLFATELAADTLDEAKDLVPRFLVVAFGNADIQDPAELIIGALKYVADVIHATFGFLQSIAVDCDSNAKNAFLSNIDNTTFQTWTLLNQIGQTTNETDRNVVRLLNETEANAAQQLTLAIESALAAPAGTVPMVAFELPASQGGFLDRSPVGVEGIVTDALTSMQGTTPPQAVNPLASRTLLMANQALGAGQYKQAWQLFRTAYAYIAN